MYEQTTESLESSIQRSGQSRTRKYNETGWVDK